MCMMEPCVHNYQSVLYINFVTLGTDWWGAGPEEEKEHEKLLVIPVVRRTNNRKGRNSFPRV